MAEKRNLTTKLTIQNLTRELKSTFAKKATVNALNEKVTIMLGTDANKSIRTIANEELVKQLITEDAADNLNELQEIAAWIQKHPKDASAMNAAITALENKLVLGTKGTPGFVPATGTYDSSVTYYTDATGATQADVTALTEGESDVSSLFVAGTVQSEYATVKQYVEAAIDALHIGNYALAADLTNLAARVEELEGIEPTKVEASETNGNIIIDGSETTVYSLPATVLHEDDIVDFTQAEIAAMLADNTFTLSNTSGTVAKDSNVTFTATVASTTTLTATSGNADVATVTPSTEADGDNTVYTFTVTGVAEGTAIITVANSANQYDANDYTITVTE